MPTTIGKLKYVGKVQIVRAIDGALVSPRALVSAYNDLLEMAHDFHDILKCACDPLCYANQKEGTSHV